jgi:hypothetical protein
LYLYGYLNQIRSSRRLEAECRRNVELMWLLGRLYPDHKSIAEFRRMHRDAVTAAGAELVAFAKGCGLIRGEWIAIDGSKFRAVASVDRVRERLALRRYLDGLEKADEEPQADIDQSAVQAALEKLKQNPEPEAGFMLVRQQALRTHKADSVASRIQLVNPAATCKVRKHRLGGQESSGSVESLIESLADCDLLIDATAEPAVFNHLCAAVAIGKKPLLWAEVFGGGFGGLIARHRPGIEPLPASMRSIVENWCADRGQPIVRPAKRYDGGPELPAIADDSDVSVIAAQAARMAIDLLIPRDPSSFPNSVYLIGLSKGWLFSQPFETYPLDVGPPEPMPQAEDDNPEEVAEELERIRKLFEEYKNAASPSEPSDPAPAH